MTEENKKEEIVVDLSQIEIFVKIGQYTYKIDPNKVYRFIGYLGNQVKND